MFAVHYMAKKMLSAFQLCELCSYPEQLPLDDGSPAGRIPVEDIAYVSQTHAYLLTGPQNAHPMQMFGRVVAVA